MKIKTLLIPILTVPILLTGCGSNNDTEDNLRKIGKIRYETSNLSIIIPQDWEIIERDSFTSNVPQETVVGFRNNIKNEIFTANVNISQTEIEENMGSRDFAKSSLARTKNSVVSFQEISTETHKFKYGKDVIDSYISEFEGKKSASETKIRFKQLFVVIKGIGYTVTGAFLPAEDESAVKNIDEMIDSFALK